MRKLKRYPKKFTLGGLATGAQALGNLANIGIGIHQGIKGKKAAEQGREDLIGSFGVSDALASFTDENKALANRSGDLANEKSDSALAGLLAAFSSSRRESKRSDDSSISRRYGCWIGFTATGRSKYYEWG